MKKWLLSVSLLSLSACSLAPDFELPDITMPALFKESAVAPAAPDKTAPGDLGQWKLGEAAPVQANGEWWRAFNDTGLNALETQAMRENQDIQAAAARASQARARVGIATAGFFPDVSASGSAIRQQPGSVIPGFSSSTTLKPLTRYTGQLGFTYEIDLLGRVLDSRRVAKGTEGAADAALGSVMLTLQADVAQTYFGLRAADAERAMLKDALKLHEDSLGVLRKRLKAGDIGELDIKRQEVETEQARTQLLAVEQQRKELEHLLAVLVGKPPSGFTFVEGPFNYTPPRIPEGIPSALLERRPDIVGAQHELSAANARIGLARAAFFPSFSLTGSGGYESATLNDVFQWSNRAWSIGPMMTVPVFQGGKASANLDLSHAMNDEAVAVYRQKVLLAFRDVEDSLSRIATLSEQGKSQEIAATAASRASQLLKYRYDSGDVSFLEWSDGMRGAIAAKRQQIAIQRDRLNATVQLIRALGGSWENPAAKAPAPKPQ